MTETENAVTKPTDPAELSIDAVRQSILPAERVRVIDRPGQINIAMSSGGHYPGCKLVLFETAEKANEFFTLHSNLLAVDWRVGASNQLFVLYTNQLTPEEIEVMEQQGRWLREKVEEYMSIKVKQAELEKTQEEERIKEVNELATDGRKFRHIRDAMYKKAREAGLDPTSVDKELGKMLQGPKSGSLETNLKKGKSK